MKVSELTGATLDWAVAKCEGLYFENLEDFEHSAPDYSTDWSQGGPIIEREKISTNSDYNGAYLHSWVAETYSGGLQYTGPKPLVAAMRCYVASKLGDEVDVPQELKP